MNKGKKLKNNYNLIKLIIFKNIYKKNNIRK